MFNNDTYNVFKLQVCLKAWTEPVSCKGIGLESCAECDRHTPCCKPSVHPPPGGMRQAKLLILHTRTYTNSCQPWFLAPHAFCVQMRHIQRLLIYKETAHPVLCPASIKSVWEGGGEEGTGLQTDLKTTALSCSVWQSSTLAAQANGRYHRHYIADAH